MSNSDSRSSVDIRAGQLFETQLLALTVDTDRLLGILMIVQWLACVGLALWVSPLTWAGRYSLPNPHIYYALLLGGGVALPAAYCGFKMPGEPSTKYVMAVCQILLSALLIHFTGGRIETHFHVFGSLAVLAMYRRWSVLLVATLAVVFDHGLRGLFYPASVYGVSFTPWWLFLEHAGWVVFENIFLIIACTRSISEMKTAALRQAELEESADVREKSKQLVEIQAEMAQQTGQISDVVAHLSTTGDVLSQVLTELVANAQETLAAVVETSTIAQQVRQTAEISRDKARHVSEEARTAAHTSELGKGAANQAVESMLAIRSQMGEIAKSMGELSNQGKIIGEVVSTVDELAVQTNLLALNASLEAAKSGEHGKGFVIVAQEVKNLSLQSKAATKRIRVILDAILHATTQATATTEMGQKAVASGETVVEQAKVSIIQLADSVSESAQAASEIDLSSQQQLIGVEQVVAAMESVREVSDHTVSRIRELEDSVNTLNQLGRQLTALVARAEVIQKAGKEASPAVAV